MAKPPKASPSVTDKPVDGGGSGKGFIIAMAVLTLIAGGGGFGVSSQMLFAHEGAAVSAHSSDEKDGSEDGHGTAKAATSAEKPPPTGELVPLPAIITNLAQPGGAYLRLEGSILVEPGYPDGQILAAKVSEDVIALLRTMTLSQLQGASGMANLRDDINDRVLIRSEGKATELIINSLLIE